jgi:hypothetical protein
MGVDGICHPFSTMCPCAIIKPATISTRTNNGIESHTFHTLKEFNVCVFYLQAHFVIPFRRDTENRYHA